MFEGDFFKDIVMKDDINDREREKVEFFMRS